MRQPVRSLDALDTAQDAALLMSQHGFRHVPVTREGRLVGMVSERDLFALQRGSLQQVSTAIRRAQDLGALQAAAAGIRSFAQRLLAQGVQARQTTQLISHLNDLLTQQLLSCEARDAGVDLQRLCWVALGSEGRGEQTIATDQDNALVLPDASNPGKYRSSQYDKHGLYTHETFATADAALAQLIKDGFTEHAPGSMDELSQTETWRQGMEAAFQRQAEDLEYRRRRRAA